MLGDNGGFLDQLEDFGIKAAFVIAGMFGALASILRKKEMTFWERIITIVAGGGTATYLTPMTLQWTNLDSPSGYGVAFIIGYVGLKFVEWVIIAIREKIKGEGQ